MEEVNYLIYRDAMEKYSNTLDKEEPIDIEVLDQKDRLWVKAKVMLFNKPVKGGEAVGLLGPFGQPYDVGKYYMKIVELQPEEE